MPRKARVKSVSGIYHIMLRGANRQEIFHDDEDCKKFLDTLQKYKEKSEIKVHAWCLMNNHLHLLLKEGNEDISITMKRIGVSFVSYYNWKYQTTGHLFQGRFKSENVETIRYLLTVTRYIHQNPVKAGIVDKAGKWKWSSCAGYYGKSIYPKGLLDSDEVLNLFSPVMKIAKSSFKAFNELKNDDKCLDESAYRKIRLTDKEARLQIKKVLKTTRIAQVKSLPRSKRNELLRKVKDIKGLPLRQAGRILGVSVSLIFKA